MSEKPGKIITREEALAIARKIGEESLRRTGEAESDFADDDRDRTIADQAAELEGLRQTVAGYKEAVEIVKARRFESEIAELDAEIEAKDKRIAELEEQSQYLGGLHADEYERQKSRITTLEAELKEAREECERLKAEAATFRNASPSLCNCSECIDIRKDEDLTASRAALLKQRGKK